MSVIVNVSWSNSNNGWFASLLTADQSGLSVHTLRQGTSIEIALTDERRCAGYLTLAGERVPCPEYRTIQSGRQCFECEENDILNPPIDKQSPTRDRSKRFSVSLEQIGGEVTVSMWFTDMIKERWMEKGADFAAELYGGLTLPQAYDEFESLSDLGLQTEARRSAIKEHRDASPLEYVMNQINSPAPIQTFTEEIAYPSIDCDEIHETGSPTGTLTSVKGQILSIDGTCYRFSPGRLITGEL